MSACARCGAILSRYAEPGATLCAPCWASSDPPYEDHLNALVASVHAERERGASETFCKRGHNLLDHGLMVNAGDGRLTRRCMECRRERGRTYQRERRARLSAQAAAA